MVETQRLKGAALRNESPCAGRAGGCEAAVHAQRLLIHCSWWTGCVHWIGGFFSTMSLTYANRPMAIYIRNCYSVPSRLFVPGRTEMLSSDGTTHAGWSRCNASLCNRHNSPFRIDKTSCNRNWCINEACCLCIWSERWWGPDYSATLVGQQCALGPKLGYNPKAAKS